MDPRAERQVRVRLSIQHQLIGAVEHLWVTVSGVEQQPELRPSRDLDPVELERFEHPPLEHRQRRLEPQQLFDRRREQRRIGAELLQPMGIPEEGPPTEERRVHRRLVAGVQQEDARPDELVLRERLSLVDHVHETGDQVVAGRGPAFPASSRRYPENSRLARTASC